MGPVVPNAGREMRIGREAPFVAPAATRVYR